MEDPSFKAMWCWYLRLCIFSFLSWPLDEIEANFILSCLVFCFLFAALDIRIGAAKEVDRVHTHANKNNMRLVDIPLLPLSMMPIVVWYEYCCIEYVPMETFGYCHSRWVRVWLLKAQVRCCDQCEEMMAQSAGPVDKPRRWVWGL